MSMPRLIPSPPYDEDGFTLVEVLIAMFVMTIVMTMVLLTMTGWVVNTERSVSLSGQASDQVQQAFMTLDQEVRYAADVNAPGSSPSACSGTTCNYWVEFESDWTTSTQSSPRCTQVEYATSLGLLRQRSWPTSASTTPPSSAAWQVLASGLSTAVTGNPFSLSTEEPDLVNASTSTTTASTTTTTLAVEAAATPYQLTVSLSSTLGEGAQSGSAQTSFTISAVNVTGSSVSSNVCGGTPSS